MRSRYILLPLAITACLFLGSQGVSREVQLTVFAGCVDHKQSEGESGGRSQELAFWILTPKSTSVAQANEKCRLLASVACGEPSLVWQRSGSAKLAPLPWKAMWKQGDSSGQAASL